MKNVLGCHSIISLGKIMTCLARGVLPIVPELKGFTAWGVLFKKETWLSLGSFIYFQQVSKEAGDSHPKLCVSKGRLGHCFIYTIWSVTG